MPVILFKNLYDTFKRMKLTKHQLQLLVLGLLIGLPTFFLILTKSDASSGALMGQFIGGYIWGAIIGMIINLFKKNKISVLNASLYGGLAVNSFYFVAVNSARLFA